MLSKKFSERIASTLTIAGRAEGGRARAARCAREEAKGGSQGELRKPEKAKQAAITENIAGQRRGRRGRLLHGPLRYVRIVTYI